MRTFKEQAELDIAAMLDADVFADEHDLNGITCICVVQGVTSKADFGNKLVYTEMVQGQIQVDCEKNALPEVPFTGQLFTVDSDLYTIDSVADNMGMLSIRMTENER